MLSDAIIRAVQPLYLLYDIGTWCPDKVRTVQRLDVRQEQQTIRPYAFTISYVDVACHAPSQVSHHK
jgi:hypothetical protein